MLPLLKAKQLVLLLQDGFRDLGNIAPTKNLILTLKNELQQLKETVAELNLPEVNSLVGKLEPLLAIVPLDKELNSPIYSQESVQIILEALRVTAGYLEEKSSLVNINFPELTVVLDELYQQKNAEIKKLADKPAVRLESASDLINSFKVKIPDSDGQSEPVKVSLETKALAEEVNVIKECMKHISEIPQAVADKISQITQELSAKLNNTESLTVVESIKQIAIDLAKSVEEIKDFKQNQIKAKTDSSMKKSPSEMMNHQHLIIHLNGKLLAVPYQKVEKVQKLALSDLKLVRNNILANIGGNEVAIYDLAALFGSGPEDDFSEKETFLAAICPTENGKIGLLFDKVQGFENLEVSKFQSILGKINGIVGISTVRTKNQNGEEPEQYQPVFVLEPAELNLICQNQNN
jgi:chemotaxis signal transduction protein